MSSPTGRVFFSFIVNLETFSLSAFSNSMILEESVRLYSQRGYKSELFEGLICQRPSSFNIEKWVNGFHCIDYKTTRDSTKFWPSVYHWALSVTQYHTPDLSYSKNLNFRVCQVCVIGREKEKPRCDQNLRLQSMEINWISFSYRTFEDKLHPNCT